MQVYLTGGRCGSMDFVDGLANLGVGLSPEACKQTCLVSPSCKFVSLTMLGGCTSFSNCATTREKTDSITWEKITVGLNTTSTEATPELSSTTPTTTPVDSTPYGRMVRHIPAGGQCKATTSTGQQQMVGEPGDLGRDVTVEECLENCRTDRGCAFVEFAMYFEEGLGSCSKFLACDEIQEASGLLGLVFVFKKVAEGSFDSPQWMMHCPQGAVLTTGCMSEKLYDEVTESVHELMRSLSSECNTEVCEQADFAGCVLRLAGHDFMDFDPVTGTGGADGCTDMGHGNNAGLSECLYLGLEGPDGHSVTLQDAYVQFCHHVSLADFVVIAAEAAMSMRAVGASQALLAQQFKADFRYGRTTAFQGCQFSALALPDPAESCVAVEKVFVDALGLDWEMAAALMGVHTLGRVEPRNSGYSGWWSTPEHSRRFNNDYFVSMLAKGWCPELDVNGCSDADAAMGTCSKKNQWQRCDVDREANNQAHEMMLNTDLCLAFRDRSGGDGILRSGEDNCCTWVHSFVPTFDMTEVIRANDGTFCNVACDGSHPEIKNGSTFECFSQGKEQQTAEIEACCFFETERADCRTSGIGAASLAPGGPAEEAVLRFASNESAWIAAFRKAWKQAVTVNAFGEAPTGVLKPLGICQ
mmetsp:Transcript_62503/g.135684  ORF Transcript_62503/g.135684 Transcript_62503/m.135684 type:complete len:641 (-) Transcript_62503:115-2037(-)